MKILLIFFCIAFIHFGNAQTVIQFTHNQAPQMNINAFPDQAIFFPESIVLNANPAVEGGTPPYTYIWQPETGLDNPQIANPVASPTNTITYTFTVVDNNGCQSTKLINIIVDFSADISKLTHGIGTIYPNPARAFCSFEWKSAKLPEIKMYDLSGKLLPTPEFNFNNESITLNLKKISPGEYIVIAIDAQSLMQYRLIIQ